jgi:hypothetical protein
MTDLRRIARPGVTKWTDNDLDAYHITVSSQTKQKFFWAHRLPDFHHLLTLPFTLTVDFMNISGRKVAVVFQFSDVPIFAKLLETWI